MMTLPLNPQDAANIPASPSVNEAGGCSAQMIQNIQRSLYEQRVASELRRVRGSATGYRRHTVVTLLSGFVAYLAIDWLLAPGGLSLAAHIIIAAGAALTIGAGTWLMSSAAERRTKSLDPAIPAPDLIEAPKPLGGNPL